MQFSSDGIIGVDMGTTSVKTVTFTAEGAEVFRTSAQLETLYSPDGAAEQDPRAVYETVTSCLVKAVKQSQNIGCRITRIGFSAAMHSVLAVSSINQPLTKAIIWMDTRAQDEATLFRKSEAGSLAYSRTGTPIHPMTPLSKLMWMSKHQPDILKRTYKFVSLKEYIWHHWFDEWQIDESMAGATGLYNLARRNWDSELLQMLGLTSNQFSQLVPTTLTRTRIKDPHLLEAGLDKETIFNIGASDGVLANLGAGAITKSTMALTMGTSLAVRLGSEEVYTDEKTQPFCYALDPVHYVIGGPSNSGGVVLQWLGQQVSANSPNSASEGFRLEKWIKDASSVDTSGLYCLPYLTGERAPLWNANARASFVGLHLQHSRAHLMRAAIEGIFFNAYWIAQPLIQRFGTPERLIVSGKLLETKWVRQLVANIFGIPVEYHGTTDASILGAVRLCNLAVEQSRATQGLPLTEGLNAMKMFQFADSQYKVCLPQRREHGEYQNKFKVFQRLVASITAIEDESTASL